MLRSSVLALSVLLTQCALDPEILTTVTPSPQQPNPQTGKAVPIAFQYLRKLFGFVHHYLRLISTLYPINVLFAIGCLLLALYVVFRVVSAAGRSLLGLELEYTSAHQISHELRDIRQQVKLVQKEAREVNKYMRVKARLQEEKSAKNGQTSIKTGSNSTGGISPEVVSLVKNSNNSRLLEQVQEKLKFSTNMEREISKGCTQVLEFLKKHNTSK